MKLLEKIRNNFEIALSALTDPEPLSTYAPKDILKNFQLTRESNAAFLHLDPNHLHRIYQAFDDFKQKVPEDQRQNMRISATYSSGKIELSDASVLPQNDPDGLDGGEAEHIQGITHQDIQDLFSHFNEIISHSMISNNGLNSHYTLVLYGSSPPFDDWHKDIEEDGTEMQIAFLPLENPNATTEMPGLLGAKKAPAGAITFFDSTKHHRAPRGISRPALHAYAYYENSPSEPEEP